MGSCIEKSVILTNTKSPTLVFSAQLLIGLFAQGLLPKVQPNLKILGVTVPTAQVPPSPAKAFVADAKKGERAGMSSVQVKVAKQNVPRKDATLEKQVVQDASKSAGTSKAGEASTLELAKPLALPKIHIPKIQRLWTLQMRGKRIGISSLFKNLKLPSHFSWCQQSTNS